MQSEIKKSKAFKKNYMKVGVKKLSLAGMMPARIWRVHAVGMAPMERSKKRRQIATAAGTASLSLLMEACGFEVEEELSTLATQYWLEGVWTGKWYHEPREAWMRVDVRYVCPKNFEEKCCCSEQGQSIGRSGQQSMKLKS